MTQIDPRFARHRVFRAGLIQFDKARMELLVDGERRTAEAKPLALLQELLTRAGAVTSKRALIVAAWGNADDVSPAHETNRETGTQSQPSISPTSFSAGH